MPSSSSAVTTSILKPWHVSVLQSPFLINQLCDPSLHPAAPQTPIRKHWTVWTHEYKLTMVYWSNSMDSVGAATAKTHHWASFLLVSMSTPHPGQALSRWCSLQLPSHHFVWQGHPGATALPGCSAGSKLWYHLPKSRRGLRKKVQKPTRFWVQLWKTQRLPTAKNEDFLCQMIALTPSSEPSYRERGRSAGGQL